LKNIILYYSYSGKTKRLAEELAGKSGAELVEVKDKKRPGKLKAFFVGCPAAMKMQGWDVEPIGTDLAACDNFIVLGPIWAGHPAPAVTSLLRSIPRGKSVGVIMVSASGNSAALEPKVRALLREQGCTLKDFKSIKG
jgi:hypothetical protein